MGIGDYMCVTLRGGAPWGFSLEEGEGETYTPFLVSQVDALLNLRASWWKSCAARFESRGWWVYLRILFRERNQTTTSSCGGRKLSSQRRIFVRVGRVLVRGSSGPLYGQGRGERESEGSDLLSLSRAEQPNPNPNPNPGKKPKQTPKLTC